MELVQHGNLSDLIASKVARDEIFSDEEASKIVKSVLEAVEYMHSKNIVHRDLKPENILMAHLTDYSQLKVADFGLSVKYESSQL
jgi:calcium/calmodulin-dependent protein kinase I